MATYRIGRSDDNDIIVGDTTVSRSHAELETKRGGLFTLRDLDNTYGTKILRDGEWLDVIEVEVSADTEVTLGEYKTTVAALVAMTSAPAAPAEPAAQPVAPAAPSQPAAASTPAVQPAASASGAHKRTTMIILIGGGVLLLAVVIALVVALIDSGPSNMAGPTSGTPTSTSGPGRTGSVPADAARGRLIGEIVSMCQAQGSSSEQQCRCLAGVLASNLTNEELRVFVELMKAQGDREKRRQLAQQFGASIMLSLGQKMLKNTPRVGKECGMTMRQR